MSDKNDRIPAAVNKFLADFPDFMKRETGIARPDDEDLLLAFTSIIPGFLFTGFSSIDRQIGRDAALRWLDLVLTQQAQVLKDLKGIDITINMVRKDSP